MKPTSTHPRTCLGAALACCIHTWSSFRVRMGSQQDYMDTHISIYTYSWIVFIFNKLEQIGRKLPSMNQFATCAFGSLLWYCCICIKFPLSDFLTAGCVPVSKCQMFSVHYTKVKKKLYWPKQLRFSVPLFTTGFFVVSCVRSYVISLSLFASPSPSPSHPAIHIHTCKTLLKNWTGMQQFCTLLTSKSVNNPSVIHCLFFMYYSLISCFHREKCLPV